MQIIFCQTSQMIADVLTKPLPPPAYSILRKILLGYEIHVFPGRAGVSRNRYSSHHILWYTEYKTTDKYIIRLSTDSDKEIQIHLSKDLDLTKIKLEYLY